MDKYARKKRSEPNGNPDPETDTPLKVGNVSMFLRFRVIENYNVTGKQFQYVTDLSKITENLPPANFMPQMKISVNDIKLEVKDKLKET